MHKVRQNVQTYSVGQQGSRRLGKMGSRRDVPREYRVEEVEASSRRRWRRRMRRRGSPWTYRQRRSRRRWWRRNWKEEERNKKRSTRRRWKTIRKGGGAGRGQSHRPPRGSSLRDGLLDGRWHEKLVVAWKDHVRTVRRWRRE